MKTGNLVLGALAALMTFVSCQNEVEEMALPKLAIDTDEMTFEADGSSQVLFVTATRDWSVENESEWVAVTPENGRYANEPQLVKVTVLENNGMDRETTLKFSINMTSKYLTVRQAGPEGSAEQLILYYNNYDREVAEKTYGSGNSYPYLDQFDGWKNETGSGAADVAYSFKGMSARSNSTSNSNYSDYEGSGSNNMFFGSGAYIATKNIALNGYKNLTLTFGTEKYSQDNGSIFTPSEFHVYLSQDGSKWVEFTDYTFAGGQTEGRWNVATASFSVPEGTEKLSVCMKTDVASSYRMDDLKLEVASVAGTAVDFTNAVEMDFSDNTSGGNQGGEVTPPAGIIDATVAEFNAAAVSTTQWYRLKGTVGGPINATYGNFDLVDGTGKVYVYGISNWSEYVSKVAEGGSIVVVGQRGDYNGKIEVLAGYIESYGESTGGGNENPEPSGDYIYFNDYDKTVAEKTYGSGTSWPYLDQFEGWKNQTGSGAANVTYSFNGMSARANSTSDSNYSDYEGSGSNNMFFGSNAYFATKNIALGGNTNLVLTFGTEKYSQTLGSKFTNSEYHIYLSQDGSKWVEFTDYTFAGGSTEGRWNVATATFTVPAGTASLSICMKVDAASAYRMDDFGLAASATAGTAVDFSKAVDMDFGSENPGGGTGGGEVTPPAGDIKSVTVAEFNAAAVSTTQLYRLKGTVGGPINATYGNFDLIDETGKVYVYGISNWADYKSKVAEGGEIVVVGQRGDYNGKIEVLEGYIESYGGAGTGGGNEGGNEGGGNTGGDEGGNTGADGGYEPSGITWTLGTNAYDTTSESYNKQSAKVNGTDVENLLKLGASKAVGTATIHVPAGTKKLGAYIVSWKNKKGTLKFSAGGTELKTLTPAANEGATGNAPYTLTLADSDYYEIDVNATAAMDVKVETTDTANGRVIIIGLKAIK